MKANLFGCYDVSIYAAPHRCLHTFSPNHAFEIGSIAGPEVVHSAVIYHGLAKWRGMEILHARRASASPSGFMNVSRHPVYLAHL